MFTAFMNYLSFIRILEKFCMRFKNNDQKNALVFIMNMSNVHSTVA